MQFFELQHPRALYRENYVSEARSHLALPTPPQRSTCCMLRTCRRSTSYPLSDWLIPVFFSSLLSSLHLVSFGLLFGQGHLSSFPPSYLNIAWSQGLCDLDSAPVPKLLSPSQKLLFPSILLSFSNFLNIPQLLVLLTNFLLKFPFFLGSQGPGHLLQE